MITFSLGFLVRPSRDKENLVSPHRQPLGRYLRESRKGHCYTVLAPNIFITLNNMFLQHVTMTPGVAARSRIRPKTDGGRNQPNTDHIIHSKT